MIGNIVGLLFRPKTQWQKIADKGSFSLFPAFMYTAILALLPAVAWFYGTTIIGWSVADGDIIRLTSDSATILIALFYLTMVGSICAIGFMIHWMSETYGSDSSVAKGIAIAGFSATPLFIAGAIGFMPLFWLALVLSLVAVCYTVYLLYLGIPAVMDIPEERGFLFASAVVAFCMVLLIVIMGGSVILWDMGAAPSFTD
jgi:Yip1 domain